jgi:tetratricopeptide (TPR) repeat protein
MGSINYYKHTKNKIFISQLAEAYTAKKEVDSAIAYWQKLAALEPQNDSVYYKEALLFYSAGRFDSSFVAVQKGIDINPSQLDYLSLSAITAYHLHYEDVALSICQKILAKDPQNVNSLLLSGIIDRDQKNNPAALALFDSCLKADPANTEALLYRAEIFVLLKKYNDALRDYSAARADLSTNPDIINNIGICYYQSGSYRKAITFFKKAILINSLHPQSNFNKGLSYYNLNDIDTATADIKVASAIWDTCYNDTCHANFLDAIYYLGMCYKKIGDLPAAKSHFELLQKEGYPKDLSSEIKYIDYAMFISREWYYILALLALLPVVLIVLYKSLRR